MNDLKSVSASIVDAVVLKAGDYFRNEFDIELTAARPMEGDIASLTLRDIATFVGMIGGPVNVMVALSFDRPMMDRVVDIATEGLSVADDEREIFVRETAADVINEILGSSTADLDSGDKKIVLSPPIVVDDGSKVHKPDGTVFTTVTMSSDEGQFDIDFIAPRNLFTRSLQQTKKEMG